VNQQAQTQVNIAPAPKLSFIAAQGVSLQRKCACGGSAGMSGECEGCQEKRLSIHRYAADSRSPSRLLPSPAGLARSTPLPNSGARAGAGHHFGRLRVGGSSLSEASGERAVSRPGDRSEDEADRAAEQVMRALSSPVFEEKQEAPALSQTPPLIQREVTDENASEMEATPETTTEPETAAPEETPASGLIVEDDAQEVGPDQMRKNEFLDELRAAVCAAADAELAAVGRDTEGCPYIERWIEYYRARDSQHIERAIRHYSPEAAGVASARDYISLISERVRSAVVVWARTGEITGVPEGTPAASSEASSSAASAASASGGIQFKGRDGGAVEAGNPASIQARLDSGHALDGGVKSRMESAFGYDFSRVRVHTSAKAAELSSSLNARAFTIGRDVAFGAGEYRPGTLIGDALIAHELAHVAQQGAATAPLRKGEAESSVLEEDADKSAVGAVLSLWGKAKGGLANISKHAMPRLRSGLRLSRCSCSTLGGQEWGPFCIQGDATYKGKVEGHLNTLNGTAQGKGVFGDLETKKGKGEIGIEYLSGVVGFLPDKIRYDPGASAPKDHCPTPTGWEASPITVFLFHEVSHAYIYYVKSLGTHSERECMAVGLGKYFTDITYNENKLRCELKLPIRPCYDGVCTKFPPPTCGP